MANGQNLLAANAKLAGPDDRRSVSRSATRALDILELMGEAKAPLRAVEIARALRLHTSTVDQLLKTLTDSSHLLFDARRKTYTVSPRLLRFSAHVLESYFGDDRIRRLLEEVHEATGALVSLATPRDLSMQIVDFIAPEPCDLPRQRGMRVPMFGSTIGAAHLATVSRAELNGLVARSQLQRPQVQAFMDRLAWTKTSGYAFGALPPGQQRSLAMALPMKAPQTPLVIGLTDCAARLEQEHGRLAALMKQAIARSIGGGVTAA